MLAISYWAQYTNKYHLYCVPTLIFLSAYTKYTKKNNIWINIHIKATYRRSAEQEKVATKIIVLT